MESAKQIEHTAAAWIVRRDSGEWTPAEEAQLSEWLNASMAHRAAFWRLEAAWEQSLRLQALGAGQKPGMVPPHGQWQFSPFFEQRQAATESRSDNEAGPSWWRLLALAAGVLLIIGMGVYGYTALEGDRYTTPVGAMASVALQDGSRVTLNTASEIRVVLSENERVIELERGEVFFDVAKDPTRPFIVRAGERRVVAVGTQFSVRRHDDDMQIVVTEGKVRIEKAAHEVPPSRLDGGGAEAILTAGAIARTSDAKLLVESRTAREAEEALSWRTGYLIFDALPLPDAIAEFNRYTPRPIRIGDPYLATLRVSGRFRVTNADAFLRVLNKGFGVQTRETADTIVLMSGRTNIEPGTVQQ